MSSLVSWQRLPISRIEHLAEAVRGAGLEPIQMSSTLGGSLIFAEEDGITYSSGLLDGQVALSGPLSQDHLALGLGLRLRPGCRQWLTEVVSGEVGVFHGGDEHDAFYTPGSLYAVAALSMERLEELAARDELVLNRKILGGTGILSRPISPDVNAALARSFQRIHNGQASMSNVTSNLLSCLIDHLGRPPANFARRLNRSDHARIVARARDYIAEHLAEPISLDELVLAAHTSRRTLQRAFADILDDTPLRYIRRLRLHRIRSGLADEAESACTIAAIANEWGISELGRLSGWYHQLFGEMPSQTLARRSAAASRDVESAASAGYGNAYNSRF